MKVRVAISDEVYQLERKKRAPGKNGASTKPRKKSQKNETFKIVNSCC